MAETDYTIRSVEAAIDVLESFLKPHGQSRGVTEAARITGHNKNKVFRILATLEKRGYIRKNAQTQEYSLGPGCLFLADATRDLFDLRQVSDPILKELAEETGDATHLYVLAGREGVCLSVFRGRHVVQAAGHIGERLPLHVGASPKLLLANLPDKERSDTLHRMKFTRYTRKTITDRMALEKQLRLIQSQGYSEAIDDFEIGLYAVGAPVRDILGHVVGAVVISFPRTRDTKSRRDASIEMIVDAGSQISVKLGYGGRPPNSAEARLHERASSD